MDTFMADWIYMSNCAIFFNIKTNLVKEMVKSEDGSVLYAVYGTLRKGNGNHRYIKDAEYLGTVQTPPNYTMLGKGMGFPYVVENGTTPITVEIYRTNKDTVINHVNSLEGYTGERGHPSNWYDTCSIQTYWGPANMFINNKVGVVTSKIIETGDWNDR